MAVHKLTDVEERLIWEEAARRFSMMDHEPPVTMDQIDQLLEQLPNPRLGESLDGRVRRGSRQHVGSIEPFAIIQLDSLGDGRAILEDTFEIRKRLIRFKIGSTSKDSSRRFTPITEVFRMAAADSSTDLELPGPDQTLESDDGRFRIHLVPKQGEIEVTVQSLGFAADEFADACIGFCPSFADEADTDESKAFRPSPSSWQGLPGSSCHGWYI